MKATLALLAAALLLAGCAGSSTGTTSTTSKGGVSSGAAGTASAPTTSGTAAGTGGSNHAPTATLTVVNSTGNAPFNATFKLEGSDPDGDALTYTLAFGDGGANATGTTLPTTVVHAFAAKGNFTAALTVTDGKLTALRRANVTVLAGGPAVVTLAPITISGSISGTYIGAPVVGPPPAVGGYTAQNDHKFPVPSIVNKITLHLAWGETATDLDYAVATPDGKEAASAANYNEPSGQAFDATEPDLTITDPALLAQTGDWVVTVYPGSAAEADYTVTVTFS
ncbi:MAG TPA: PKD domain-containing protein [Candidatus Thermoplasmatota archaeon]|nr:PKD domain-containing protein [Candidatus Thermoplasmatota archaeon]